MKPCPEFEPLLAEDATGALAPAEAARVGAHLAGCAACRAERDALADVLGLAALPPVSDKERRALDGLAQDALGALRRADRSRVRITRGVLGAVAACAAALLVFGPPRPRTHVDPVASGAAASVDVVAVERPAQPTSDRGAVEGAGDREGRAIAARPQPSPSAARAARGSGSSKPRSADPTLAPGSAVAEAAGEIPSAGDTPRAALRGTERVTGSGILAPAAVGETGSARSGWEGPDLDTLWHDTDVLEVSTDGELDL